MNYQISIITMFYVILNDLIGNVLHMQSLL